MTCKAEIKLFIGKAVEKLPFFKETGKMRYKKTINAEGVGSVKKIAHI